MEKIGEQKTRLSERLQQRQEQELAEVATLTKASLTKLSEHLTQHVSDELTTTSAAIARQSEQITRLIGAQQQALKQQQETVEALKRLSLGDLEAIHGSLLEGLNKVKDEAILGSIDPLRQVMGRLQAQGEALNRLTFRAWAKSLLISLAICLGVWGSVQAGMSWLAHEIRSQRQVLDILNGEISQAEQTLAQLPRGITFVSEKGKHYIVAKQIGSPFEVTNGNAKGKMAVGVK